MTWESSDSAIVRIGSASALSAVIVGGQVGTADVTAEFLVKGRPQTTYLRLTVAGPPDHLTLVTHTPVSWIGDAEHLSGGWKRVEVALSARSS